MREACLEEERRCRCEKYSWHGSSSRPGAETIYFFLTWLWLKKRSINLGKWNQTQNLVNVCPSLILFATPEWVSLKVHGDPRLPFVDPPPNGRMVSFRSSALGFERALQTSPSRLLTSISILSRDPSLSENYPKPWGTGNRFLKRTMAEKNGKEINP